MSAAAEITTRRHPVKALRILRLFADGHRLTRFDAERVGDHTLPGTVFALQRDYGLIFNRQPETVPGYAGTTARAMRYWLNSEQQVHARQILAAIFRSAGTPALSFPVETGRIP